MTYSTRHLNISLIFYKDIKLTSCQSVRGLSHLTDCKVKQQNIEIFTFLVKNYEEMKKKMCSVGRQLDNQLQQQYIKGSIMNSLDSNI